MRPGDFSPGNNLSGIEDGYRYGASMRPGDFSPGNSAMGRVRTVLSAELQ